MKKFIVSVLLFSLLTTTASASVWGTPESEGWASKRATTEFTVAEDEFLQEVGVLALDKNAMLVNGAIRYINDDNLQVTPRLIEARTYLPLSAAEVLLKLYTETKEEEAYVDIRYNDIEITDGDKAHYLWTVANTRNEMVLDGKTATLNDVSSQNEYLIYVDGEPYVALRKLSEKIGKEVYYEDGYIVIGDSDDVDYVIDNATVFERAKTLLADYTPQSQGNTLYVSADASTGGNGTINNPYSLAEASSVAQAGDTVILRGGTYREMLAPVNDGTASKPIIYKAYKGEKVIISALEKVTGFSADAEDETLVSATAVTPSNVFDNSRATEGRHQVFYNGKNIPEARYPNIDTSEYAVDDISPLFQTKGDIKIVESVRAEDGSITPTYQAESSTLLQDEEDNKWVGATLVTLHGSAWATSTAKVTASSKGYLELDATTATKRWWFSQKPSDEKNEDEDYWTAQWGYLTGHRAAIDLAGEWVVEDDKIVMKLPQGATADNLTIEMKARQLCINLTDKKFIHIDGIETIGGGVTMNNTEMCVVKNCNFSYISHFTQSIDQREAYIDTSYEDGQQPCEDYGAPQRGEVGIYLGGKNDVLRDCTIDTSAGAAVYMTGSYTYVHNNNMINTGYQGSMVGGIYISAVGHTPYNLSGYGAEGYRNERGGYVITNNTVRNVSRAALTIQPPEYGWKTCQQFAVYMPCDISYNEFSNGCIASCDSGVIYATGATMGTAENQSLFHHNMVYIDAPIAGYLVSMIYYDSQVYEMSNYDNICFKAREDVTSIFDGTTSWKDSIFVCATEGESKTYSVIGKTDNEYLGYFAEGKAGLSDSDYPGEQAFITGVR